MRTLHAVLLSLALSCISHRLPAQGKPPAVPVSTAPGVLSGTLVDAAGQPVTGGSVTVRRAADTAFAGGAIPGVDGRFRVEGLALGRYKVRIRVMGFALTERNDLQITAASPSLDLGKLTLARVSVTLDRQVVAAERNDVILAPDRNVYAVKDMPALAGGTAIDALRATPGVDVDGSDNISLRGNQNVVIHINGRPSPLRGEQLAQFLRQLPSGTLERIEVTTSPSAKSDPEGTAGIINIVLRQDVEIGLSGSVNVTTGSTGQLSGSGNVARQEGRLKFSASPFLYRDSRSSSSSLDRASLVARVPDSLTTRSAGEFGIRSGGFNLRSEFERTKKDIISGEISLYANRFNQSRISRYEDFDAFDALIGQFDQNSNYLTTGQAVDGSLTYRRVENDQITPLIAELRFSNYWNGLGSTVISDVSQSDASMANIADGLVFDRMDSSQPDMVGQVDYTHQFGKLVKLESGTKATWRITRNSSGTSHALGSDDQRVPDPEREVSSLYRESFQAIYGVMSERAGKWTLQQGLRFENTDSRLESRTGAAGVLPDVTQHYRSPFPSASATYAFSATRSLRGGFSRRISRPWAGSLAPVVFRVDQRTVSMGNPELRPEYTNALELTYNDAFKWGTFQLSPFRRETSDAVRFLRSVDSMGVSVNRPENVARIITAGADVNLGIRRGPLQLNLGGSVSRYSSDAPALGPNYSVRSARWSARANGSWKVDKQTTLQANAMYRPPMQLEGARVRASSYLTTGVRRTFAGGKGSVTANLQDPFNWQRGGMRYEDGRVRDITTSRSESRAVTLTFSRSFGNEVRIRTRVTTEEPTSGPPPTP